MRLNLRDDNRLQTLPPRIEGWQEASIPDEKQVQTYGLAASCLGMAVVSILLGGEFAPRGLLPAMVILAFAMPIHELIHALSTPNWGLSTKTVIEVQKRKGLFMPSVLYDGEQALWRFLLTGLAPTMLLTVLPIMMIAFAPLDNTFRAWLGFLSFFNVAISGGDLFLFVWLLTRLPPRSHIRQMGWKLYWKTKA